MKHLHGLAILVVALGSTCFAEEERFFEIPDGMKDPGMLMIGGLVRIGKARGPKSKTLKAWGKQAESARSKGFRLEAVSVLRAVAAPLAPGQEPTFFGPTGRLDAATASGVAQALRNEAKERREALGLPEKIKLTDEEKDECREAAMTLAKSSDDIVVWQALSILKEIGDESCCKVVALHAGHMQLGQLACEILGKFPCESSIPALVKAAETNSGEHAIAAIAKIGGAKAKDALEKLSKGKLGKEGTTTGEAIAKALDEIEARE